MARGVKCVHHWLLESRTDQSDPHWIPGTCRDCGKKKRWPAGVEMVAYNMRLGPLSDIADPARDIERDRWQRMRRLD
jgi:RNase P subunit RPR2